MVFSLECSRLPGGTCICLVWVEFWELGERIPFTVAMVFKTAWEVKFGTFCTFGEILVYCTPEPYSVNYEAVLPGIPYGICLCCGSQCPKQAGCISG